MRPAADRNVALWIRDFRRKSKPVSNEDRVLLRMLSKDIPVTDNWLRPAEKAVTMV